MKKRWMTVVVVVSLSACNAQSVKQSEVDIEQRHQIEQDNAAKEARVRQEEEELAHSREQARKREQAARQAANSEVAVVQQEPLSSPKSSPDERMGTGLFVSVKRGRTFASVEIETLTHAELQDMLRRASPSELRAHCTWLVQWIRMKQRSTKADSRNEEGK
jgi:hypothetical protein